MCAPCTYMRGTAVRDKDTQHPDVLMFCAPFRQQSPRFPPRLKKRRLLKIKISRGRAAYACQDSRRAQSSIIPASKNQACERHVCECTHIHRANSSKTPHAVDVDVDVAAPLAVICPHVSTQQTPNPVTQYSRKRDLPRPSFPSTTERLPHFASKPRS